MSKFGAFGGAWPIFGEAVHLVERRRFGEALHIFGETWQIRRWRGLFWRGVDHFQRGMAHFEAYSPFFERDVGHLVRLFGWAGLYEEISSFLWSQHRVEDNNR